MLRVACFDFTYEIVSPLLVDGQNIVGNPHDVGVVALLEHQHLINDVLRRALPMAVAENLA